MWKNSFVPPAFLLSETSMLPCPVLMVSAEPYLLFPVLTGNSGPDNPLSPAPLQFLLFSLHYACSEISVFRSSHHPPLYISKRIISGWLVFDNWSVIDFVIWLNLANLVNLLNILIFDSYHIIFMVFSVVKKFAKNGFNDLLCCILLFI